MATFQFDLVSPEKLLFSGQVEQVDIPGSEGDLGILAGHAPLVATLRPGIIAVRAGSDTQRVVIFGGVAEVSPAGLTVLADNATPAGEIDAAAIAAEIKNAEEDIADTSDPALRDKYAHKVSQLRAIQTALSGTAAH